MCDVLVYGPVFCDLIFTELPQFPVLGKEIFAGDLSVSVGGSAIVTLALKRLGLKVNLIADLGNDPISQLIANLLSDLGIDQRLIRRHPHALKQVTTVLSYPEDRAFITRFEEPGEAVDLTAIIQAYPAKHLHICSFLTALENPKAVDIAHEHRLSVSMDPGWDDKALLQTEFHAMIPKLDFFMPSESEICYMFQTNDLEEALERTAKHLKHGTVVLKRGARGALALNQQKYKKVATYDVTPVDTTGAGDAFDAGFIYGHLKGEKLERCLRYGAICGALTTTAPGITAIPHLKEVEAWLSK